MNMYNFNVYKGTRSQKQKLKSVTTEKELKIILKPLTYRAMCELAQKHNIMSSFIEHTFHLCINDVVFFSNILNAY